MAKIEEVRVPDIGDIDAVDVVEVLVSSGDTVAEGDSLIVMESEKASMDIPAPFSGVVREVLISAGDQVSEGVVVAKIEASNAAEEDAAPPAKEEQPKKPEEKPAQAPAPQEVKIQKPPALPTPPGKVSTQRPAYAGPSVRRFARELGVDLHQVNGTGRKGRITKDDVKGFVKSALNRAANAGGVGGSALPPMPVIDFSKFGEVETRPLGRIPKLSAASLHRSWLHVPHVTQFDEADITEMEAFRKAHKEEAAKKGLKLTPLGFLLKAAAAGLKTFPKFNASLDQTGENLILKKYCHIGVAVDTPNGLVVPVIRDVDKKSLYDLAGELAQLSGKARDGKLKPTDIQGACFTISSLGGIGGTAFTPIVNAPEVAILGVSRSSIKPVYQDGEFQPRLMLPLSLSYDHRVIDGADAARFTTYLSGVLSDLRRLLL